MPIYKFLASDRLDAIANGTLRATQSSALNDPFELRPFFKALSDDEFVERAVYHDQTLREEWEKLYPTVPSHIQDVLPLPQYMQLLEHDATKTFIANQRREILTQFVNVNLPAATAGLRDQIHTTLARLIGIISFSSVATLPTMWAYYSSDHQGYVIEFDDAHPFFDRRRSDQDEFFHLRTVNYLEPPIVHENLANLGGSDVFCVKQSHWSHEAERRILWPLVNAEETTPGSTVFLVEFAKAAVRRVIIGAKAPNALQESVQKILSKDPEYSTARVVRATFDYAAGAVVIPD